MIDLNYLFTSASLIVEHEHELATVDSSPCLTPRDIKVLQQNVGTLVTDCNSQALIADETRGDETLYDC